ncbi:MAG TPA: hypothetical protein VEM96_18930 [Pyrinomonadaceae bacterium]|nr:hypothetical protein [Pyrinomonadaceae bacterium]
MSKITKEWFEKVCCDLKPQIETIRKNNRQEPETGPPTTDARSAILYALLLQLNSDLNLNPPFRLQPVSGPTREATLKTGIRRFVAAHSDEDFNPYPGLNDLLADFKEGEM